LAEDANSGEDDNALKSVAGKLSSGSSIMDTAGAAGSLQKLMALREEAAAPIALAIMAEGKKALEDVPRAGSEALTEAARTGGRYGTAIAVLGVYNGATEFAQAYKKGDLTGQFVSAADTGMGLANVGIQTAAAMGKEMSPLLEGGAKLGGTVVLVAQRLNRSTTPMAHSLTGMRAAMSPASATKARSRSRKASKSAPASASLRRQPPRSARQASLRSPHPSSSPASPFTPLTRPPRKPSRLTMPGKSWTTRLSGMAPPNARAR
jgi:hypothetical protein